MYSWIVVLSTVVFIAAAEFIPRGLLVMLVYILTLVVPLAKWDQQISAVLHLIC